MKAAKPAKPGDLIVFSCVNQDGRRWELGLVSNVDREGYATHYKKPGGSRTHHLLSFGNRYVVSREQVDMDRLQTKLDFNFPYPTLYKARIALARFLK